MTSDSPIYAAKRVMRKEMSHRRATIDLASREAAAGGLARTGLAFASPQAGARISGYAAIGTELDPVQLLRHLAAEGHSLGLPVTVALGQPLVFRQWAPGEPLVAREFGLRVPPGRAKELRPDILLVPLLAFDARGYRLGYGAGYYDRTLAALRRVKPVTAIGIAFDVQEVEKVPHDRYDERLDWILTPSGPRNIEGA